LKKGKVLFSNSQPPVSVIIYAKSESVNLQNFLPSVLEQDYPEYEVIVVNDDSTDYSENVLRGMQNQYKHLYYTYIPQGTKNLSRKKLGLTLGIKAARYGVLLFIDADTHPVSEKWISCMARHFNNKNAVVLGFSALEKHQGIKYKYAAFDYFTTNLQMISMAMFKIPYGADGKNLAYSKEYFDANKGYSRHRHLQAGEDDLFINEIATKENLVTEMSPESITITSWEEMFDWKHSKINRAMTSNYYKIAPRRFCRIELWSRIFFVFSVFACIFYNFCNILLPIVAIIASIVWLFSQLFVINKTAGYLKLEKFYFLFPFFNVLQSVINIYFYIYRFFGGKNYYIWKYEN
jgi:glycosyltransferase involved in cell wall biosynthesis